MKNEIMPEVLLLEEYGENSIQISKKTLKDFKQHSHDFYEFEYVFEGEGICKINNKEYHIQKGDVSFVTPLDIHGYECNKEFKLLTIHFRVNSLSRELLYINTMEACVVKCSNALRSAFEMLAAANENEEFYELFCEKALEIIVIQFLQMLNGGRSKDKPNEIRRAVEYINLNFRNNIKLQTVSAYVGYSPEHFSRQFKKYLGKNFVHYLSDLRLSHAKNLLNNREISVTQACYECGFGSLRSLNRAFKAKYGCSPQQYKYQKMS